MTTAPHVLVSWLRTFAQPHRARRFAPWRRGALLGVAPWLALSILIGPRLRPLPAVDVACRLEEDPCLTQPSSRVGTASAQPEPHGFGGRRSMTCAMPGSMRRTASSSSRPSNAPAGRPLRGWDPRPPTPSGRWCSTTATSPCSAPPRSISPTPWRSTPLPGSHSLCSWTGSPFARGGANGTEPSTSGTGTASGGGVSRSRTQTHRPSEPCSFPLASPSIPRSRSGAARGETGREAPPPGLGYRSDRTPSAAPHSAAVALSANGYAIRISAFGQGTNSMNRTLLRPGS